MRNRWILLGYLALFFLVVSFYDAYRENDLLVTLAAAIILIGGLAAWIWSLQPKKGDEDGES
jgi:uncharacterized membrane protein YqjE